MNTKDILKRLPNDTGAGYFTVHLQSMDKDIRVRHLSVNDQKIISKLSIDEGGGTFASEGDLAKIALTEENSLEPIELEKIDVRDFFILCCAIRKENYMDPFAVRYKCEKCEDEFDKSLDFDRLVQLASEYELSTTEAVIKTKAGDMKVHIGIPAQLDLVMLEMYYERVAKTRDVTSAEKFVDYIICCMTKAFFKNDEDQWEEMEDFAKKEFLEKVDFVQSVQANIEEVSKLFNDIGMITSEFFYEVECPTCQNKIRSFMDTSDFFTL
jgi:hypothetical protein